MSVWMSACGWSSLCIVDELGAVCLERTVASGVEEIADAVRDFTECVEGLAFETDNLASWLAAGLGPRAFG
jgi:transposase